MSKSRITSARGAAPAVRLPQTGRDRFPDAPLSPSGPTPPPRGIMIAERLESTHDRLDSLNTRLCAFVTRMSGPVEIKPAAEPMPKRPDTILDRQEQAIDHINNQLRRLTEYIEISEQAF